LWWLSGGAVALLVASVSPPPRLPIDPDVFVEAACLMGAAGCLSVPPPAPPPPRPVAKAPLPAWPAPGAGVRILVSIPQQKAWVFAGAALVATSPVSTGKPGHETPTGIFHILQKAVHHRSNRYSNAPMPFMQRLTQSGVALHAGHLPGYPASHGCIRLPWGFAKRLYGLTGGGSRVTVTRLRPRSAKDALRLA
jgi:lipoprotein-anchoring transpeptidase ErfK/SrfK